MITKLLLSVLILVSAAAALPQNVSLGEYEVSFDLGDAEYVVETEEVVPEGNSSGVNTSHICWLTGDGTMMIALTEYASPVKVTASLVRRSVIDYLNGLKCKDLQTHEEDIDKKPAILGLGESPSGGVVVSAVYWPDIEEVDGAYYGNVDCTIASTAPVEPTESLLNSIHVALPEDADISEDVDLYEDVDVDLPEDIDIPEDADCPEDAEAAEGLLEGVFQAMG